MALIGLYHRHSSFFWLWMICGRGILKLGLIRKGWRRLLSEIEYRSAANKTVPLVKVYSCRQARAPFRAFDDVRITHHVEASHFPLLGSMARLVRCDCAGSRGCTTALTRARVYISPSAG
jgi:hypothetical protein